MSIWTLLRGETLRTYLEPKTVAELVGLWQEADLGAYSPQASVFFDVLEGKPGGKAIANRLWHQQGDFVVSHMAKRAICLVPNAQGQCPCPVTKAG